MRLHVLLLTLMMMTAMPLVAAGPPERQTVGVSDDSVLADTELGEHSGTYYVTVCQVNPAATAEQPSVPSISVGTCLMTGVYKESSEESNGLQTGHGPGHEPDEAIVNLRGDGNVREAIEDVLDGVEPTPEDIVSAIPGIPGESPIGLTSEKGSATAPGATVDGTTYWVAVCRLDATSPDVSMTNVNVGTCLMTGIYEENGKKPGLQTGHSPDGTEPDTAIVSLHSVVRTASAAAAPVVALVPTDILP